MPSVRDRLERLTFQMQAPQLLYLNRDRVDTLFVARLGAIKEYTEKANVSSKGSLGLNLKFLGVGGASTNLEAGGGRESSVTYTLEKPIAQALVLEAELTDSGAIRPVATALRGQYVTATGTACFSRPGGDPVGFTRIQA